MSVLDMRTRHYCCYITLLFCLGSLSVSAYRYREVVFVLKYTGCQPSTNYLWAVKTAGLVLCLVHCYRDARCEEVSYRPVSGDCVAMETCTDLCSPAEFLDGWYHYQFSRLLCPNDVCPDCQDCMEIKQRYPQCTDGLYTVNRSGSMVQTVQCHMETDCGGWTEFQRREIGDVSFDRDWVSYKEGFEAAPGDHWLGNSALHSLTQGQCELRIEMDSQLGVSGVATYATFHIGNETEGYRLTVQGYSGSAGWDALGEHDGMMFSTFDLDQDSDISRNCAQQYVGGWWYHACFNCKLNSVYNSSTIQGMRWGNFPGGSPILHSKMMLRCQKQIYPWRS